jgi:hypothetical protein
VVNLPHSRTARTHKHRAALHFGSKVPVFPCGTDKRPYTQNGFKAATTDRARITAWWNRFPNANPAMRTGEQSGYWVLDVDNLAPLEELERLYGKLPATRVVRTPSGGLHVYFRHVEGITNSPGALPDGIHVRGEGGYVLLPGSVTEGTYEIIESHPVADAPEWLVELVRRRTVSAKTATVAWRSLPGDSPILEGARNQTLFFVALDLKDSGNSRDEALAKLLDINEARCSPPLPEAEVEGIIKSGFRYPVRRARTPPEVLEALAGLKRAWWATAWRGVGGKSDRDVLRVLIQLAERYGHLIPVGVRISVSWRDLAIAAACRRRTVGRVIKRLRLAGWLRGDNAERTGADSGAFVLLARGARRTVTTQSMDRPRGGEPVGSGDTLSRLPELTPCFRWRGFVGKGKAGALYVLEVFGPQSLDELAERLGFSRPRDLRRLYLEPLAELGLIEDRGGVYALPGQVHYVRRVQEIRSAPYGGGPRKFRSKDMQGHVVSRVVEVPPMSELERDEADREVYEAQRQRYREGAAKLTLHVANLGVDGFIGELERVPALDEKLRDVLRDFLRRHPNRRDETPSWLSVALWAEEYTPGKTSLEAVELALADLQGGAA